jgi:hypothetical protein
VVTLLPSYATVDDVRAALDVAESARSDRQITRILRGVSRDIDGQMHRRFYPLVATRTFDWPDRAHGRSWRLWLGRDELISVTILSSGGTTIAAGDYLLRPDHGPPYDRIELNLSSSASFGGGATHQRDVTVTGVWGHGADTEAAGTLAEDLDATETGVDVSDSTLIGVGDLLLVGSERMVVTGRGMLDTGQDLTSALTASTAAVAFTVASGAALAVGETLLVDSERMRVTDIAANTVTVRRAVDGSVLAAHSSGASVFAPRTLTVVRGALGTTAAAHSTAAAVSRHVVPDPIRDLAVAEALVRLGREQAGYARTVGSGDGVRAAPGGDIRDIRARAAPYRRTRHAAI